MVRNTILISIATVVALFSSKSVQVCCETTADCTNCVTLETIAVKSGSNVQIDCPVTQVKNINWMSSKTGKIIASTITGTFAAGYGLNGGNLTIANVNAASHAATYSCSVVGDDKVPVYYTPLVVITMPASKMTSTYNGEVLTSGATSTINCTVPTSSPAAVVRFFMSKTATSTYAELSTGVSNSYASGDATSGSTIGTLSYPFYPNQNGQYIKCQADISTYQAVDAVAMQLKIDTSKYLPASANTYSVCSASLLLVGLALATQL